MPIVHRVLAALAAFLIPVGACAGSALAAEPAALIVLAREAPRIVTGRVTSSIDISAGRMRLHSVTVARTLKGDEVENLTVLEESKSSIELLERGQRYLLFLEAAPNYSLVRQQVPKGADAAPMRGRAGVVKLPGIDDAAIAELIELLRQEKLNPAQQRAAFRLELHSGADRLVIDAAQALKAQSGISRGLEGRDIDAIAAALGDRRTSDVAKAALIRALGRRRVNAALALLRELRPSSGVLVEARAEALKNLGHPIAMSEIADYLEHTDPGVREFGVRALANAKGPEARQALSNVALESGPTKVRIVAVEALGKVGDRDALGVLKRTFEDSDPAVQQATGRALFELGTPEAHDTLEALVMDGRGYEVQSQALLLLVVSGFPTDDPRIQHIREEHSDPRIRKIIDEGLTLAPPGHAH